MKIKLGNSIVGEGCPPLFLPDIGTFFNQDVKMAILMIKKLHQAGVRIIKGEILHNPNICLEDETKDHYVDSKNRIVTERYRELIERKVVSLETYEKIFNFCCSLKMDFAVSVYDNEGADFAKDIGAVALKIASSNIVHQPLIEHVAQKKLPILIDTGKSSIEEIARAVNWFKDAGGDEFILEYSPPAPPIPIEHHNMKAMVHLGRTFDCLFGLSDHHSGDEMLYAAATLEASVIETGVCLSKQKTDQDVNHSVEISEVPKVLYTIDLIHKSLGSQSIYLRRDREKYISRMGLVAKRNLSTNDRINHDNVEFAFPAKGIVIEYWELVKDARLKNSVRRGLPIGWNDLGITR
jgi:sialic acid synthase SpsE